MHLFRNTWSFGELIVGFEIRILSPAESRQIVSSYPSFAERKLRKLQKQPEFRGVIPSSSWKNITWCTNSAVTAVLQHSSVTEHQPGFNDVNTILHVASDELFVDVTELTKTHSRQVIVAGIVWRKRNSPTTVLTSPKFLNYNWRKGRGCRFPPPENSEVPPPFPRGVAYILVLRQSYRKNNGKQSSLRRIRNNHLTPKLVATWDAFTWIHYSTDVSRCNFIMCNGNETAS